MTVYLIKFTLFSTLALSFTAGREIGAAQVHGDWKHLTFRSGNNRVSRNAESLIQTPVGGAGQNQQKPPARKRKSLYEYSPEDLIPGTQESGKQENETFRPQPGKARQPRATRLDQSSTRGRPSQTPIARPISEPAQIGNSGGARLNGTAEATPPPPPQKEPAAKENRGKLTNIIVLFFFSLVVLIYLVIKLLQQLREAQETPLRITAEEAPLAIEERPLSVESEPATERPANRAENDATRPKQKMRKARYG